MGEEAMSSSTSGAAIDSSNIGFKLLKKHGWKEGTGLGVSEQGRLEPVEAEWKNNKRGLGSEKKKKPKSDETYDTNVKSEEGELHSNKSKSKTKTMSKKTRKLQELEKRVQEKEFERAFFREFWPDNV